MSCQPAFGTDHSTTQSSQLPEPQWTDPGLKSEISVCQLISASKKKSAGMEWIVEHFPKILTPKENATLTTPNCLIANLDQPPLETADIFSLFIPSIAIVP